MNIAKVHATMRDEIRSQGPLTDKSTGQKIRPNRGVARAHKAAKRTAADLRNGATPVERTRLFRITAIARALNANRKTP
jgi:hypothetical protein